MTKQARIALLPLDERPVNTRLVGEVAQIAGFECAMPPAEHLPDFRKEGRTERLSEWLQAQAENASALVVSIDTLIYGGLIAARTTENPAEESVGHLSVLRQIHEERPNVPILAVSLVTRASDSYSNVEEPEYWSDFGRDLHHLGKEAHRAWAQGSILQPVSIPADVREDFAKRRLRNHVVNLTALQMRWDGVLSYLALTADDTAEFSAGSAEQQWFEYWRKLGAPTLPVIGYPGADETGAVLMARAVLGATGNRPRVKVVAGNADLLELVPPYENGPIRESISRQINAAGGEQVTDGPADMVLVIHGPDPQRGDLGAIEAPLSDEVEVRRTVGAVQEALVCGVPVVLADVRYANGGDAMLVDSLAAEGLLGSLAAYGGWNTAGNALGGAIATGLAVVAGTENGSLNVKAQQEALRRRLLDDVAYQAQIRRDLMLGPFQRSLGPVGPEALEEASEQTVRRMNEYLTAWGISDGFSVSEVRFPWKRSFEVDIDFS